MANQRIFLWAALALVIWLNYDAWQRDYASPPPPAVTSSEPTGALPSDTPPPSGLDAVPKPAPAQSSPAESAPPAPQAVPAPATDAAPTETGTDIQVLTDVLDLRIALKGGELKRADLLQYPKDKHHPDVLVRLFNDDPAHPFVFRSGLTSGAPGAQPDHQATFTSSANVYRLADGQDELKVPLTWTDGQGLTVTKTYTFGRGKYAVGLEFDIDNRSGQEWSAAPYLQFLRKQAVVERSMFDVESYSFMGPAVYAPDAEKYHKLELDDEEDAKYTASIRNGWLAAMQHHFVAAAVPDPSQAYQYSLRVENGQYLLGAVGPSLTVPAGSRQALGETIFVGPKLQAELEKTGPELDRVADYGRLTIIARPLFQLLQWVHGLVGNWGWAIVLVTFLIKLVFYPLSEASGRSMAKMRALAPRIKNIQERFKDDREQLGRAMMELYKREKINPLAGCLPILVQIPVFLAFYWVLLESVEMRQAPFMLWIDDLSSRDPIFVLPLLMGAAMFGQYKLNPAPPDPMQAKVFMFMPIIMTVMFAWFPAGLVLYWLTNTVLSIAQQWRINRVVEAQAKKHATS
jgi:YidC/Oxa1 family membrane protein insertase